MASEKERRKERAAARKLKQPPGARPRQDGDRHHRGADLAREAQKRKQAERDWNIDSTPDACL